MRGHRAVFRLTRLQIAQNSERMRVVALFAKHIDSHLLNAFAATAVPVQQSLSIAVTLLVAVFLGQSENHPGVVIGMCLHLRFDIAGAGVKIPVIRLDEPKQTQDVRCIRRTLA